jgi:hypothetical protein
MRFSFHIPDKNLPVIQNWVHVLEHKYLGSKPTKEIKAEDMPTIIHFLESINIQINYKVATKERIQNRELK